MEKPTRTPAGFPVLDEIKIHYLDNAATTQKPGCVISAAENYYRSMNANPMRGLYALSIAATDAYEHARKNVADFINAKSDTEIVFTRNASESLNLVAYSYGMDFVGEGDEIITTIVEHHSNFLPWKHVCDVKGATLKVLPCEKDGSFSLDEFKKLLSPKTKLVAMTQLSNVFGRSYDVAAFAAAAHEVGAVFVCDGAQSVPHMPIDVQALDVDFLAFSGHKMYAPMGIGVLYGKKDLLEAMPPFLYGGEMIEYVTVDSATFAEVPHKFEAGTVNVGGAVGLDEAIEFMKRIGWDTIMEKEDSLTAYAMERMNAMEHISIIGADNPEDHHGIITFMIDDVHPHDVAAIFDEANVAVRAGHHCAQPLHKHLGLWSTTRASIAFYNTTEDIDAFLDTLGTIRGRMGYA